MNPNLESSIRQTAELSAQVAGDPTAHMPMVRPGRWFGVLCRRSWVLALVTILAVASTWAWIRQATKTYRAQGAIYVSTEAPRMLDITSVVPEESRDLEQLRSVAGGMSSSTILLRVIENNGLASDPAYTEGISGEQELLKKFRDSLRVELRRGTRIIDIEVEDTNPQRARDLVESIKSEYEKWTSQRREDLTEEVSRGLAREELRLREKMKESARRQEEFREANAVPGLDSGAAGAPVDSGLEALRSQWTQARAQALQFEAQVEALKQLDTDNPDSVAALADNGDARELLSLVRTLQDKRIEFSRIKERYLYKHPAYKESANEIAGLEQTIAQASRSVADALENSYRVASQNEQKLAAEVKRASERAVEVEGLRARFASLGRDAQVDRDLHATVAKRLRETTMAASAPTSVLRWEEMPLVPENPYRPRKEVLLAASTCGGLILGFLLALVLEMRDIRVRDDSMAAKALGAPMLVRLPEAAQLANGGMVMTHNPGSQTAEAFRRLRAVLAPRGSVHDGRTVLFTSARSGEGKSFVALNYAASLAMQGYRTLLIDADLRSGALSRDASVGGATRPGLGDYLAGIANPADACLPTGLPKLYLLAAGSGRDDGAELLGGVRFPALLRDAFRWFDRVVIDTPAVHDASDVQAIARYADHICMIVNPCKIKRRDLDDAAAMLRAANGDLIGFVWNEAPCGADSAGAPFVLAVPGDPVSGHQLAVDNPMPASSSSTTILSIRRSA